MKWENMCVFMTFVTGLVVCGLTMSQQPESHILVVNGLEYPI